MKHAFLPLAFLTIILSGANAAAQVTTSRVFVTSTTYLGNLGGISGADQKCQARATAADLGGTWHAWVSGTSSGTWVSNRLTHASGPYRLLNISPTSLPTIANNWADLTDGSLRLPINVDENTATLGAGATVWTGTMPDGSGLGGCNDYNSTGGTTFVGSSDMTNTGWTNTGSALCSGTGRLYCFEEPLPTAANIFGHVLSASGRPIRGAQVTITSPGMSFPGTVHVQRNGFYVFATLLTGVRYTITASQRRFTFAPKVVMILGDVNDLDFIGTQL